MADSQLFYFNNYCKTETTIITIVIRKLYLRSTRLTAKIGHGACPSWARCFLIMGTLLAPVGQNCWQTHAQYLHFVVLLFLFPGFYQRMQFLSSEFLTSDISKPSRQLADSWITVNWLDVRILQQKTRQSDSFSAILGFTENQRYGQLLLISTLNRHYLPL